VLRCTACGYEWSSHSVMKPTGQNSDVFSFDLVDQPMLLRDATGPTSFQFMLQGFGLAGTLERRPLNLFNQFDDS